MGPGGSAWGSPSAAGGTDLISLLLPLPCPAVLCSSPPGQILSLQKAAPSSSPTTPCRAVWVCSTTCVVGKEPGVGAQMLAAASLGPPPWLAVAVNSSLLLQSLKNLSR